MDGDSHIVTIKCLASKVRKTETSHFKVMFKEIPSIAMRTLSSIHISYIIKVCFKNTNSSLEIRIMKTRVKEFPGTNESSQANFSCIA